MTTTNSQHLFRRWGASALSLITALSVGAAVLIGSAGAQAEEYPALKLRFAHPYNEAHPLAKGAQMFADLVEERSGGQINIAVFPNGTVGSARELIESMQINVIDFALIPTTDVAGFYPRLDVFYLPFLFRDRHHAYAVSDREVGQKLFEDMRQQIGIRTLAMYESGFRTLTTSNTKIESPDDMKGIKLRVVNNPLSVATFTMVGANPTPMAMSELFTALQQGTVDGQDNPISNVRTMGYDQVQKYITLSNHQWAGIMFLANDKKFASYPIEVQNLLTSVALETQEWEREELNRIENQFLAEMEADGMTVTRLSAEQTKAFQDKMEKVWDEYGDKIGAELIQAVQNTN